MEEFVRKVRKTVGGLPSISSSQDVPSHYQWGACLLGNNDGDAATGSKAFGSVGRGQHPSCEVEDQKRHGGRLKESGGARDAEDDPAGKSLLRVEAETGSEAGRKRGGGGGGRVPGGIRARGGAVLTGTRKAKGSVGSKDDREYVRSCNSSLASGIGSSSNSSAAVTTSATYGESSAYNPQPQSITTGRDKSCPGAATAENRPSMTDAGSDAAMTEEARVGTVVSAKKQKKKKRTRQDTVAKSLTKSNRTKLPPSGDGSLCSLNTKAVVLDMQSEPAGGLMSIPEAPAVAQTKKACHKTQALSPSSTRDVRGQPQESMEVNHGIVTATASTKPPKPSRVPPRKKARRTEERIVSEDNAKEMADDNPAIAQGKPQQQQ